MHLHAFLRLIWLSSYSSHPGVGIYLRAARILPLLTLTARSGAGWYVSGVFIQPNMWDKDFACAGTLRRKQETHREPPVSNKRAFQRGI